MSESFTIPADMIDAEMTAATGSQAAVSIRDLLIALGVSDEELAESDARTAQREADEPAARAMVDAAGPWHKRRPAKPGKWQLVTIFECQVINGFDPDTNRPAASIERLLELRSECESYWRPTARP